MIGESDRKKTKKVRRKAITYREKEREKERWEGGWFIDGEDERGARNRSLIYCITWSRFTRAESLSLSLALILASLPPAPRFHEIRRADNAKGPAETRGNAAPFALLLARHRQPEWTFATWLEIPDEFTIIRYVTGTRPWHTHTHTCATTMTMTSANTPSSEENRNRLSLARRDASEISAMPEVRSLFSSPRVRFNDRGECYYSSGAVWAEHEAEVCELIRERYISPVLLSVYFMKINNYFTNM